jgi:hypothetical protein
MNIVKTNPAGIDIPIAVMQTMLYGKLKTIWSLDDTSLTLYGRAYKNQTDDGYTPEVYVGNNEYKDVFFDDSVAAMGFFGVGENTPVKGGSSMADVFLILMVDLSKIKSGSAIRNDEEARLDIQKLVFTPFNNFTVVGYQTGLDTVFKEYSGWKKKTGMQFRDQHPKHCFRINFKLLYSINQTK